MPVPTAKRFACMVTVKLPRTFPKLSPSFELRAVGNGERVSHVDAMHVYSAAWSARALAKECHAFLWEQVHSVGVVSGATDAADT